MNDGTCAMLSHPHGRDLTSAERQAAPAHAREEEERLTSAPERGISPAPPPSRRWLLPLAKLRWCGARGLAAPVVGVDAPRSVDGLTCGAALFDIACVPAPGGAGMIATSYASCP